MDDYYDDAAERVRRAIDMANAAAARHQQDSGRRGDGMVGGIVIEVLDCKTRVWVNCKGTGSESGNQCAIMIERTPAALSISPGDSLWWQSQTAFWTPKFRILAKCPWEDYKLKKIGFSGVSRPQLEDVAAA